MKKLLVILLLTFTSLVYAGEGRYTMVLDDYGVFILDSKDGSVKFCTAYGDTDKPKHGNEYEEKAISHDMY